MPSITDIILLLSLCMIGVGVAFQFTWPIACITVGAIILLLILRTKFNEEG